MTRPLVAVFDRLPAEAGAQSFPHLQYTQLSVELARGAASTLSMQVPLDAIARSSVKKGRILMVTSPQLPGGRVEVVVASVSAANTNAQANVTTLPLRYLLKRRGYVRELRAGLPPQFAFNEGALTVRRLFERFVLANAAADGLGWILGVRQIDYPGAIDLGAFDRIDRSDLCDRIERETQQVVQLTREDRPDGTPLGYWLELVRDPGATAPVIPGYVVGDLVEVSETDALLDTVTAVLGVSDTGALMGETAWRVSASETTSPAWVQLIDPSGGEPPIAFDAQLVGAFLRLRDGSQLEILASRASDSAVRVSRPIAAGTLVGLVADAAGAPVTMLTAPAAVLEHGILQAQATVARVRTERNYLDNADLARGRSGWTHGGSPPRGRLVARSRLDATEVRGVVRANVAAGASTIPLDDMPAGPLHRGDALRFDAYEAITGAGQPTATGTVSVAVAPVIPTGGLVSDTPVSLRLPNGTQLAALTDGAQSAGAASIALKGLPVVPALVIGQTLIVQEGGSQTWVLLSGIVGTGTVTFTVQPVGQSIGPGTLLAVTETWRYYDDPTGLGVEFRLRETTFTTIGTLSSSYAAGDASITIDFAGARQAPISHVDAPPSWLVTGSFTRETTATRSYTVQSAPAWNAASEADVLISPAIAEPITPGTAAAWSGSPNLVVEFPLGAALSATTVRVRLRRDAEIVSGTVLRVAGEDVFLAEPLATPQSGQPDVALLVPTVGPIPAGRPARIVRVRDLAPFEPGSDTTLQFDAYGLASAVQVVAIGQSVVIAVAPGQNLTVRARAGGSVWGILQPGRQYQFRLTGVGATASASGVLVPAGDELGVQHVTLNAFTTISATTTITPSIDFQNVNAVNYLDARLRYAMLTVSADANVPFILDSGSNRIHQRCNNVLQSLSDPSRFVLTGRPLEELLDRLGTNQVLIGQRVRVRDAILNRDVERRIQKYTITWDIDRDGREKRASRLEVGTLDPRLSRVTVVS